MVGTVSVKLCLCTTPIISIFAVGLIQDLMNLHNLEDKLTFLVEILVFWGCDLLLLCNTTSLIRSCVDFESFVFKMYDDI